MSQLISILLAPYHFFFGENGLFPSSPNRRKQDRQGLYFGLPALVFAILGLLFLVVGELNAGKTLVQKYKDNVEEIRKESSELKSTLVKETKIANATGTDVAASDPDIKVLREQLVENLDTEEIMLSKLFSLAPDEPQHLYDLAITYLTKSNITLRSDLQNKAAIAEDQRNQGVSIMRRIAPTDNPGYLQAHLFLAQEALSRKVQSRSEIITNLRLATVHLDQALIRDQENATALRLKVLIAQKTRQTEEAKKFLDLLFAKDPFVYPQLCKVNEQLGLADQNVKILRRAELQFTDQLTRSTGTSDRRTKLATYLVDCLHRLNELDKADERVRAEMAQFSDNAGIQRWGKRLLAIGQELRYRSGLPIKQKNAAELIGYLREGYRLDPNNQKLLVHIVALRRDKLAGLEQISKEIYVPGPKAPASVENLLGTMALTDGDYLEATKRFAMANKKAPGNPEYLNNLSFVYLTRPDPDPSEALKLVDKAVRNVRAGTFTANYLTNFLDTKGRALLALGKVAEEQGDLKLAESQYASAVATLLRSLKDRPKNLEITKAIVECYQAIGQTEQVKVWQSRVDELQANQTK